jgi:plasmid stabilization system protein ParE
MILLSPAAVSDAKRLREFLETKDPYAAKRALGVIWAAFEKVKEFPDLGRPTEDPNIRQMIIRFGSAGYVSRYTILPETGDVLILRIWHGREART